MVTIDRFLRQVSVFTNRGYLLNTLEMPSEDKRFSTAESHFALMIRADMNGEGAKQARDDARWNYYWTLRDLTKGTISDTRIVELVDRFAEDVVGIGQQPNNKLRLPDVAQAQPTVQATLNG